MSADVEMTTAQLLEQMAPDPKSALDEERKAREQSHWCVCFLPLDLRGREVGLNGILPAGLPFLFRSRSYQHRSDSLDDGAAFWKVSTQYARDAVNSLRMMYTEHGFTVMDRLKGKDSEAEKLSIARAIAKYMPHWRNFDNAEDPDWDLFKRRAAHLRAAREMETEGSIAAIVLEYLIDANAQTASFMTSIAGSILAEAEAGRQGRIGRTKPTEFELQILKWAGRQPSRHFDGYGDGSQPQTQAPTHDIGEILNVLREGFLRSDEPTGNEENDALRAMMIEQQKQIAALTSKLERVEKKVKE